MVQICFYGSKNFRNHIFEKSYLDGLSSRIIEFSSLSNRSSSRSQQKNLLDIWSWRRGVTDGEGNLVHGLFACLEEGVEHEFRIGGPRGSFGVELSSKIGSGGVGNTLVRSVVSIGEKSFPSRAESGAVNDETVVLGSDVALSSLVVQDRLVLSTVTKWQLLGGSSGGYTHELVTKTNTINRLDLVVREGNNLFELFDGFFAHHWVTRSVRQEKTIVEVHVRGEWVIPWDDGQFTPALDQVSDNIVFHTAIDGNNLRWVALSVDNRLFDTDFVDQMAQVGILDCAKVRNRGVEVDLDLSHQGSRFSDFFGKHTGIDATKTRNSLLFHPVAKRRGGVPVRIMVGVVLDNQTIDVNLVGFKVFGKSIFIHDGSVGHTIVTDHRCCQGKDLTLVGRIGHIFRVSNHTGGKNNLFRRQKQNC